MSKHAGSSIQSKKLRLQQLLEQNRLDAAKDLLADLCRRNGSDPQLWLMYGAVNQQLGNKALAASAYTKAIAIQPTLAVAHYQLGALHLESGRPEQALANLHRAVELQPDFLEALCNLGSALEKQERYAEAVECYERALRLNPQIAELHFNLGNALQALARLEEAGACYRQAIGLRPDYVEALDHLGVTLAKQDRHEEAVSHHRRALGIRPDHFESHYNLAVSLKQLGQAEEAIAHYRRALVIRPQDAEAHNNLGAALAGQYRFDEALAAYREALRLKPDYAEAHNNLGVSLEGLQRYDEALAAYREALRLKPDYAEAYSNLANAQVGVGQLEDALRNYRQALALAPDNAGAHFNLSVLLLLQGNFHDGWEEYRWQWWRKGAQPRPFPPSLWDGSDLNGRSVFLHAEQGLGDELFFLRFVPWLKRRGAGPVTYRASHKLASLLARFPALDRVCVPDVTPAVGDAVFSIGDLPRLLGMKRIDQTPPSPLLTPLPQQLDAVRARLRAFGPPPYLGVTWRAGTATKRGSLFKECPSPLLARALRDIPGTVLVLQRQPAEGEIEAFAKALGRDVQDLSALNEDLEQMLALLALLDEYLGVGNTNMHLRAGVGKTARVLVPAPPEWRWMAEGRESPWFPGFTVYRQGYDGKWERALGEVERGLMRPAH